MRIYLASSWRNPLLSSIVASLREEGFYVYDFRETGFKWDNVHNQREHFLSEPTNANWIKLAQLHPVKRAFDIDMRAFDECDVVLCVLPCNRSAHMELGMGIAADKDCILYHAQSENSEESPALELLYVHKSIRHAWSLNQVISELNRINEMMT